jgi:hypothetical protein
VESRREGRIPISPKIPCIREATSEFVACTSARSSPTPVPARRNKADPLSTVYVAAVRRGPALQGGRQREKKSQVSALRVNNCHPSMTGVGPQRASFNRSLPGGKQWAAVATHPSRDRAPRQERRPGKRGSNGSAARLEGAGRRDALLPSLPNVFDVEGRLDALQHRG